MKLPHGFLKAKIIFFPFLSIIKKGKVSWKNEQLKISLILPSIIAFMGNLLLFNLFHYNVSVFLFSFFVFFFLSFIFPVWKMIHMILHKRTSNICLLKRPASPFCKFWLPIFFLLFVNLWNVGLSYNVHASSQSNDVIE